MIAIDRLTFGYPKSEFRLDIPELRVALGEKLAVIGPSGSGKTTLLNLVSGIFTPERGNIGDKLARRSNDLSQGEKQRVAICRALLPGPRLLLDESKRQLLARAETTPLVVGAKGSSLDLVKNSIYFGDTMPELISVAAADRVEETDLALPIPLYVRFKARGFPIVGTNLDYLDFRGLTVARGRNLTLLGDCVLGAAAEALGLEPGDSLLSSPQTLFDLAGVYPLKMRVAGVLSPTHSADDLAGAGFVHPLTIQKAIMKPVRRAVVLTAIAILMSLSRAQAVFADTKLQIYTVNYPLAYFAERIAGDLAEIRFPAPPDVDPAFWMPGTDTIAAYQAADRILLNGAG